MKASVLVLSMAGAFMVGAAQAQVVFSDLEFTNASWTAFPPRVYSGIGGAFAFQCVDCGPSGLGALRMQFSYTTDGSLSAGVANTSFVYRPLVQGAISTIDAHVMKNLSANFTAVALGNNFRPLIIQGGKYYAATIAGPALLGSNATGWNSIERNGLRASDFSFYDPATGVFGAENPDFVGGAVMTFGLLQLGSLNGANNSVVWSDYHDFRLSISAVPEPQAAWLFLAGLVSLGRLRLRGQKVPQPG